MNTKKTLGLYFIPHKRRYTKTMLRKASFSCSSNNFFRGKRNTQSDGSALLLYQYQRQSNTTLETYFLWCQYATYCTMFFLYIYIYMFDVMFLFWLWFVTLVIFYLTSSITLKVICTEKLHFSRAIGRKNLLLKLLSLKLHLQMTYYWNQNHINVSYVIQYGIFWR